MDATLRKIVFILIAAALTHSFTFTETIVETGQTTIRQNTYYKFTIRRNYYPTNFQQTPWNQQSVPPNSNIILQFPSQYNSSLNSSTLTTFSYTTGAGTFTSSPLLTTINNNIFINNFNVIPLYISSIVVQVSNIINPAPAIMTSSFVTVVGSDLSETTDTGVSHVQLTPGSLLNCKAQFQKGQVNRKDNLTISFTSSSLLPASAVVKVTFPSSYLRDPSAQPVGLTTSMSCSTFLSASSISCNATLSNYTVNVYYSLPDTGSSTVLFTINDILVPPSTEAIDTISIRTYSSTMIQYDSCSCSYSNIVAASLSPSLSANQTVYTSNAVTATISVPLVDVLYKTDYLILTLDGTYYPLYQLVALSGTTAVGFSINSYTVNTVNFSSTVAVQPGQMLSIGLKQVYAPNNIAEQLTATVTINSLGYSKAEGTTTLAPVPTPINNIYIHIDDTTVGQATNYHIYFSTLSPITTTSMIRLQLPNPITIPNSLTLSTLNSQTATSTLIDSHTIQLTSLPSAPASTNNSIVLALLTNPLSVQPLQTPLFITLFENTSTTAVVASGSHLPTELSFSASATLAMTVTADNLVVNHKNTSWQFSITTVVGLPAGSTLNIVMYSMQGWTSATNLTCRVTTATSTSNQLCSMTYNTQHTVAVVLPVSVSNTVNITLVNAMTNPSSTQPTISFSLASYSSSGQAMETSSSQTFLWISTPQTMLSFNVSRSSTVNSALSNYTLSILQQSSFAATGNNQLLVVFPAELSLASATCASCTITNNKVLFTLPAAANTTGATVTVQAVKNAFSLKATTTTITALTLLDTQYNYSSAAVPDNNYELTNTLPSSLALDPTRTNYSNHHLFEPNTLNVAIDTTTSLANYYQIQLNTAFNGSALTCTVQQGNYICLVQGSNVKVVPGGNNTANTLIVVTVANFNNPATTSDLTYNTTLEGFSEDNFLVNRYAGTSLQWNIDCLFPCKTCPSTTRNTCNSCYSSTATTLAYLSATACLTTCPATAVADTALICQPCLTPCLECAGSVTNCTACNLLSEQKYLYNFTCIKATQCPSGTYAGNYQCLPCFAPCLECNATNCLSCIASAYFYLNQCYYSCPSSTVLVSSQCVNCSSVCATCSVVPQNCTSCPSGTVYENYTCISQCSSSFYILGSQCVQQCSTNCLTCSIYAERCTSCSAPLYLLSALCVATCPPLSFPNTTSRVCESCSLLSLNCSNCRANPQCSVFGGALACTAQQLYECVSCDGGLGLFYNATLSAWQCLTQPPDGYVNINGVLQLCSAPCLTCSYLINNCTLCKSLYYLSGQCLSLCPSTYYPNTMAATVNSTPITTLVCSKCLSPCYLCTNSTSCLSCSSNTYYYNNSCVTVSQCPVYFYPNSSSWSCEPCPSPCSTCSSYYNCLSCTTSNYLLLASCVTVCPPTYFPNATSLQCQPCPSPCLTCLSSGTGCLSCNSTTYYYSYNYSCLGVCPAGFYSSSAYCLNCTAPCLECTSTICQKCIPSYNSINYYLYQGSCISSCPYSTFPLNDSTHPICEACSSSCFTCSSSPSYCTSCNTLLGYRALSNDSSACVLDCPPELPVLTQVVDQLVCKGCSDVLCLTCLPTDKCVVCLNYSLVLLDGKCYSECPNHLVYFLNTTTNTSACNAAEPTPPTPVEPVVQIVTEGTQIQLPFQFPCSISAAALIFIAILVKSYQLCLKQNEKVMLAALMSAALALPEIAAMGLSAYSYFLLRYKVFTQGLQHWDVFFWCYCVCVLATVGVGVYVWVAVTRLFWTDRIYLKWTKAANCYQKCYQYGVALVTPFNFKVVHGLFCGIRWLPLLQSSSKLGVLNFPSALSALVALVFTLASGLNINFHPELKLIYIDCIVVVVLSTLMSLLALRRDRDFYVWQLEDDTLKYPVNRRIAGEEEYFNIVGISPEKDSNMSLEYSNRIIKKEPLGDSSDQPSYQSRSRPSFTEEDLSVKSRSVRLQNLSLQCTLMEDSQDYGSRVSSDHNSVVCLPAGKSTYSGILWEESQKGEEAHEDIHPTNLGMLQQGQDSSVSASNDEVEPQNVRFVLPLQFRRYAFAEQAQHNYSAVLHQQPQQLSEGSGAEVRQSQKARPMKVEDVNSWGQESMNLNLDRSGSKGGEFDGMKLKVQEKESEFVICCERSSPSVSVNSDDPEMHSQLKRSLAEPCQIDNQSLAQQLNEEKVSVTEPQVVVAAVVDQSLQMNPDNSVCSDPSLESRIIVVRVRQASKQVSDDSGVVPQRSVAVTVSELGNISLRSEMVHSSEDISGDYSGQEVVIRVKAKENSSQYSFSQEYQKKEGKSRKYPTQRREETESSKLCERIIKAIQQESELNEVNVSRSQQVSSIASSVVAIKQQSEVNWINVPKPQQVNSIKSSVKAVKQPSQQCSQENLQKQIRPDSIKSPTKIVEAIEEQQQELDCMNVSKEENWSNGPELSDSSLSQAEEPVYVGHKVEENKQDSPKSEQKGQLIKESSKSNEKERSPTSVKDYHSIRSRGAVESSQIDNQSLSSYHSKGLSANLSSNIFDRPLQTPLKQNQSDKMKASVKMIFEKYADQHEIVDEEVESMDLEEKKEEGNRCESERKKIEKEEGNQFRITTVRRKKKNKEKGNAMKVIYVDQQKFKILKNQARKIQKQTKINQRLREYIQDEREEIYRPHRFLEGKEGEQEPKRSSLTKIESVYLTPPKAASRTPPKPHNSGSLSKNLNASPIKQ